MNLLKYLEKQAKLSGNPYVSYDELAEWPAEQIEEAKQQGCLVQTDDAESIICRECPKGCWKEVEIRQKDGHSVGVYFCEDEDCAGLIEISVERLQQWQINKEKLLKPARRSKTVKYSRKNQKQSEKALIVSTLLQHHRFGMDSEFNFELLKQEKLGEILKWKQSRVSRALKRSFPKGFWKRYRQACKVDTLKGFLKILDDEQTVPEAAYYHPQHPTDNEEKLARQYE